MSKASLDRLRSYVALTDDQIAEARSLLVQRLQEEDALARASRANTDALSRKFGLNGMGDQ